MEPPSSHSSSGPIRKLATSSCWKTQTTAGRRTFSYRSAPANGDREISKSVSDFSRYGLNSSYPKDSSSHLCVEFTTRWIYSPLVGPCTDAELAGRTVYRGTVTMYCEEFFGAILQGGAPDDPQNPARPYCDRPGDLSSRGRPRAYGHLPPVDRRISPLFRRPGIDRHTGTGRSSGHEVTKPVLTKVDS